MSSALEQPRPPAHTPGTTRIVAGESAKPKRKRTLEISLAVGLVLLIGAGAAVASSLSRTNEAAAAAAAADTPAAELRLGYFGNITHAPALVGVSQGLLAKEPRRAPSSAPRSFNAGPAAIEALNAGAIDATYIGPNPAINSYVKSKGESISIIAGAAVRRGAAGGQARDQLGRGPQGQEARDAAARRHPGRGPPRLARPAGLPDQHGRQRRRRHQPHRKRPDPETVPGRKARRRVAAGAVGLPPGAPGRSEGPGRREGPVGRQAASSSPPS